MADASFAMRSHGATPVQRNDRPAKAAASDAVRPAPGTSFAASFAVARAESASAALASAQNVIAFPDQTQQPTGPGLLSTGVQFLLAETRTQEASAKFPAPANLERARDAYLDTQARVRDTIAANRLLQAQAAPGPSVHYDAAARPAAAQAYAGAKESGIFDEE